MLNLGVLRPDMEALLSLRNCGAAPIEYPRSQGASVDGWTIPVYQVTRIAWRRLEPGATAQQRVFVPKGVVSGWYRFSIQYAPVIGGPSSVALSNTVLMEP